jgi:hypothetical protein
MKIKHILNILLLGVVFISLNACNKEDDAVISIVGKWKASNATVSPSLYGETDFFTDVDECWKDNIIEFKNDGTYAVSEGATSCPIATLKGQASLTDPNAGNYAVNQSNGFNTLVFDYAFLQYFEIWSNDAETDFEFYGPYTLKLEGNKMILTKTLVRGYYDAQDNYVYDDFVITLTYDKQP